MGDPTKKQPMDELAAYYSDNHSMRQTATKFGISVERVRQLLRCHRPELIRPVGVNLDTSPRIVPK
jgi:hypothetical protein